MNVIRKRQIKYLKLCLISPWYEQIVNLLYLISLPLFAINIIQLTRDGSVASFTNYEVTEKVSVTFHEELFKTISTPEEFTSYLENLLNILYSSSLIPVSKGNSTSSISAFKNQTIQNSNFFTASNIQPYPYFITLGNVRMIKYSLNSQLCKLKIDKYTERETLYYTIRNNSKCFSRYSAEIGEKNTTYKKSTSKSIFDSFVKSLPAKFSSYDLISDGQYVDLNLTEYTNNPEYYKNFLNDPNMKFLVLIFNIYSVYSDNYVNVVAGVEMLQYFTYTHNIFTSSIFSQFDEHDLVLFINYVVLITCSVLNILKLIYEMNLKLQIVVHLCLLMHEVINFAMIVFFTIFMTASKDLNISMSQTEHVCFISLISIKSFLMVMLSLAIFSYPFRLVSFLSWFKLKSKHLTMYLNVIFRMLPGVLILTLTFSLFTVCFSFMLYMVYNEYFQAYSTYSSSLVNLFNLMQSIKEFYENPRLIYSLNLSSLYIFYNTLITIAFFVIIFTTIATYTYLFKKASVLEVKKDEDEVITKLEELKDMIESLSKQEETEKDKDDSKSRRQIIWLCLTNDNETYNEKSADNYKIMLFTSSTQIIAFLKYLFAIKPKMQFENLDKKFAILVECKAQPGNCSLIREKDLDQIDVLFDWLNFAGCRIPVAIYNSFNLDRNLKMSISSTYWNCDFISTKGEINDFFDMEKEKERERERERERLEKEKLEKPTEKNDYYTSGFSGFNLNNTGGYNPGSRISTGSGTNGKGSFYNAKGPRFSVSKGESTSLIPSGNNVNPIQPSVNRALDGMLSIIDNSDKNKRKSVINLATSKAQSSCKIIFNKNNKLSFF
jgi:hypothetical protein